MDWSSDDGGSAFSSSSDGDHGGWSPGGASSFSSLPGSSDEGTGRPKPLYTPIEKWMYDPKLDAKTEEWVDKVKFKDDLLLAADELSSGAVKGRRKGSQVLACPGCFTQICWNSQPHVKYHGQYRAMFVENCQVDEGKRLYYPRESATAQPVRRTVGPDGGASTGSAEEELRQESDVYRPVKCDECGTTVGVVDEEKVYHLFHVLPEL